MPDTGPPWNIPYVEPTDLVRAYPQASEDLADAIADGLDAAGGLVAVKHALFTGAQTNSTAAGANFAVDDLTITHTLADAANKLIISAYLGLAGSSFQLAQVGLAVADNGTLVAIGNSSGSRTRIGSGGRIGTGTDFATLSPSVTFVYLPGNTLSHTYTVRAINLETSTATVFVNRTEGDSSSANRGRASSALVIQEVKV